MGKGKKKKQMQKESKKHVIRKIKSNPICKLCHLKHLPVHYQIGL